MNRIVGRALGLGIVLVVTAVTFTAGETPEAKDAGIPLITDWTHQHVIFSQPRTAKQRAALQRDIRYQQQLARHNARPNLSKNVDAAAWRRFRRLQGDNNNGMHRDWAVSLGATGAALAGRFPAKYSFSSTVAVCGGSPNPDFIVFATGVAPSGTQASIVGLTNLYQGCPNTPVPASYFAYNTGGTVTTSPVLSYDGTQFAFTQTVAGTASLVLVRWTGGGTAQVPVTPTLANGTYLGCAAPCMATFSLGAADTNSSVFYDYDTDVAYVGDDAGKLHKFTGVFKGTPAQVTSGGWPVTVSGNRLSSAVFDGGSGNAFVGDSGGFLYRISSAGGVTASLRLDRGTGLLGGPIVDRGISAVYVFSSHDATATSAAVYQLPTNFGSGASGSEQRVGTSSNGTTQFYNGAFDHNYIFSANSTGSLYVCGNPGARPRLYKIPIVTGVMQTAVVGPILATTAGTPCSPVADVYNPTITGQGLPEEWAFASVQAAGNPAPSPCGGVSCLMSFRTSSWQPNTVYNAGQLILDSNMNIQVADNSGFTSGAAQPAWATTVFGQTPDGGVHWLCQGALSGQFPATWTRRHVYNGNFQILDTNGNIEINRTAGARSGTMQPTWPTAEGATTTDGNVTWYNLGANPVAAIPQPGGTSGIVMDNTTLPGSQVYFSTLGGGCAPGGTGNCAVQVSQQGLN